MRDFRHCLLSIGLLIAMEGGFAAIGRMPRVTPEHIAADGPMFRTFAVAVWDEVDHRLKLPDETKRPEVRQLLALRVHLAIYFDKENEARDAAARIRALQGSVEEKAYAGLVTEALLEAHAQTGDKPGDGDFNAVFRSAFRSKLRDLPPTEAMRRLLSRQRERIVAYSREKILREMATLVGARKEDEAFSLDEADALIRTHHILFVLLPVQPELIQVLDEAISSMR